MLRRVLYRPFVILCAALAAATPFADLRAAERPNFIFFLVDDMGWADVGCNGSTFHETPHIDQLAQSGMRFTNGYAACPVCSPTRASIVTGRHPVRVNITDWIPGMSADRAYNPRFEQIEDRDNLALEEVTIAEVLKDNGYDTFFAGKWHLGSEGHLPTDQGFDINIGGHHRGSPPGGYYAPFKNPYLPDAEPGEYLTERLTKESLRFLDQRGDDPFLLYLAYYNIHTPIQAYKKRVAHYEDKRDDLPEVDQEPVRERRGLSRMRQDNPALASMVAAVDDSVGAILSRLRERGLDDNTVVMFFSDNGGLCTVRSEGPGCNLPLRSGKGWLYEGGIREPMIIRAPGVAQAGTTCDVPVCSTDFFPTMLELASLPLMPQRHADGQSLVPLLRQQSTDHGPLFWHYPHYHGSTWTPGAAIRDGDWKLIELYEFGETELYNLKHDVGEANNLAAAEPARVQALQQQLRHWQQSMNAQMPVADPDYNPDAPFLPPARDRKPKKR